MNEHKKWSLCSTHTCTRGLDVWKWIFITLFQCCQISDQQFCQRHNFCLRFCLTPSYSRVDCISCLISLHHWDLWCSCIYLLYIIYLQAFVCSFKPDLLHCSHCCDIVATAALSIASADLLPCISSSQTDQNVDCNHMHKSTHTSNWTQWKKVIF